MKKYALILIIISFIFTTLLSCLNNPSSENKENDLAAQNQTSSNASNVLDEETIADDDSLNSRKEEPKTDETSSSAIPDSKDEKKQITISNSENINLKENSSFNSKNSSQSQSDKKMTSNTAPTNPDDKVYTSNLGFSLTFPASWKNLYTIIEDDHSFSVYFKQIAEGNYGQGLLFTFQKKTDDFDEGTLDTIGNKRYFVAKDVLYIIGGATDVNFSPDSTDFTLFQSMHDESANVINTIKILN